MKKAILIRYGELFLKGKNKGYFEDLLIKNIKSALTGLEFTFTKISGRYVISGFKDYNATEVSSRLQKVFGITRISECVVVESTPSAIFEHLATLKINAKTFKVDTIRADKTFPLRSQDVSIEGGAIILKNNPGLKVDVHKPEVMVEVDIREDKNVYICTSRIPCLGGMPVGSAGEGLLLLSGGIDSPVAGFQMNKRGMHNTYIHYYSYPYTSQLAKDKVVELAKTLKPYNGTSKILFVPFTKVQEEIHKHCDGDYMITLMRRIMMRIARAMCLKHGYQAIVTGECLGQVASQTIESMTSTNLCAGEIPVLRPLISFDKEDTVAIAKKIGSYETSILPYEDCCTVFLPKTPIIRPKMDKVLKQESFLDIDGLVNDCIENIEIMEI